MRRLLRVIPPVVLMAGIWIMSDEPSPGMLPPFFEHQDKVVHFLVFALLGAALAPCRGFLRGSWGALLVIGLLWAGLDEIHQSWVPGRDCSAADFLADAAGLPAGMAVFERIRSGTGRGGKREVMFRAPDGGSA